MRRRIIAIIGLITGFSLLFERPAAALPGEEFVADKVGDIAGNAFSNAANGMVQWVIDSVQHFTGGIVQFLATSGDPQIDSVWFSGPESPYASVRAIALTLLLAFVLLGTMSGLLKGDVGGMLRRMVGSLPTALAGMALAPQIVAQLLKLVDELSTSVLNNSGGNAVEFLKEFGTTINAGTGGFGILILALLAILSALLLWIELLLRSALVYFLVALSPLAFASMVWPSAKGVTRRLMELLVGAIFSKLVICVALAVGAAALGGVSQAAGSNAETGAAMAAGIGNLVTGTTLLILAAWSPFLLMRMMPVVETAVIAQGVSRGPIRAASKGASTVSSLGTVARIAGASGAGAAAGSTKSTSRVANSKAAA